MKEKKERQSKKLFRLFNSILGEAAGAKRLVCVVSAHVSGVSPLTGGDGLIKFLKDLTAGGKSETAVETTLNSAGCDRTKFEEMDIPVKDYVKNNKLF